LLIDLVLFLEIQLDKVFGHGGSALLPKDRSVKVEIAALGSIGNEEEVPIGL
jgi:hypothetical protein